MSPLATCACAVGVLAVVNTLLDAKVLTPGLALAVLAAVAVGWYLGGKIR